MSPLPPIQQNGDAGRLEQLASGLKRQNGTFGPVIQRNPVGRPASGQAEPEAPTDYKALGRTLAVAEANRSSWGAVADYWEQIASESPTPFVKMMRDMAAQMADNHDREFTMEAARVYNSTPNAEY